MTSNSLTNGNGVYNENDNKHNDESSVFSTSNPEKQSKNQTTSERKSKQSSMDKQPDDYYSLLGVSRNATQFEIKKAYKTQAFLFHPDKNKDPSSHRKFARISAAFEVLSTPAKRKIYDAYGAEGLKRSATFNYGGFANKNSRTTNDPEDNFRSFTTADIYENEKASNVVYKDPPIYHDLYASLEEILEGAKKKVKITRKSFKSDHTSKLEEKMLLINIKPGWKEGTKIIFEREGDRRPGVIPSDIIFVLRDKSHALFKRSGNDVIFTARIPLKSALLGDNLWIPMLNKEKKLLTWTDVIHPRSEKRLKGMGLPYANIDQRGDLIVHFDIIFPKTLSTHERHLISYAIPPFYSSVEEL